MCAGVDRLFDLLKVFVEIDSSHIFVSPSKIIGMIDDNENLTSSVMRKITVMMIMSLLCI